MHAIWLALATVQNSVEVLMHSMSITTPGLQELLPLLPLLPRLVLLCHPASVVGFLLDATSSVPSFHPTPFADFTLL